MIKIMDADCKKIGVALNPEELTQIFRAYVGEARANWNEQPIEFILCYRPDRNEAFIATDETAELSFWGDAEDAR